MIKPIQFKQVDKETWEGHCPFLNKFWNGYILEDGKIENSDNAGEVFNTPEEFFEFVEEERLAEINTALAIASRII